MRRASTIATLATAHRHAMPHRLALLDMPAGAQTAVEQRQLAPAWVPLLPQPPRALEPHADWPAA